MRQAAFAFHWALARGEACKQKANQEQESVQMNLGRQHQLAYFLKRAWLTTLTTAWINRVATYSAGGRRLYKRIRHATTVNDRNARTGLAVSP